MHALGPIDLDLDKGEFVAVVGASGSGKSTLLSFIAGDLEPPFAAMGRVSLDDMALDGLPPEARHIGRLFQDDLLFPHLSVAGNLLFGMPRGPRAERLAKVEAALAEAELARKAGISALTVPTPDFGPGILAMALWALVLLVGLQNPTCFCFILRLA